MSRASVDGMSGQGDGRPLRVFVALDLPANVRAALAAVPLPPGLRPVAADKRHITLNFMGGREPALVAAIGQSLGEIEFPAFDLRLEGLAWFRQGSGGALVAPVATSAPLRALKQAIDQKISLHIGPGRENRAFRPHATLGRMKAGPPPADYLKSAGARLEIPFRPASFTLFASRLLPSGPVCAALGIYPLA